MALVEELIERITDPDLRAQVAREINDMKNRLQWGLVFERHMPETTRLVDAPVKPGAVVWERRAAKPRRFRVRTVRGAELTVVEEPSGTTAEAGAPTLQLGRADVLVEKQFADPVFPGLTSLGSIRNGPDDRPSHAVIRGENYHAITALLAAYEGKFDVIYLDPPYNTGDRDWAYNNDYVDTNDQFRPSKWLAFMERRLEIARRLLQPKGVIVVTIDENEVNHLGMLLEQLFPDALIQMATICINPSGASADGLSRVDEYAYFCFFGGALPAPVADDLLQHDREKTPALWESLLRRGSSWTRESRKNLCYPVLIDAEGRIAGVGGRFEGDDESQRLTHDGEHELAWPVRTDGKLGIWRVDPKRLKVLSGRGLAYATKRDEARGTWSLKYVLEGGVKAIDRGDVEIVGRGPKGEAILRSNLVKKTVAKTMWHRGRHTAGGSGGTQIVTEFIGRRGLFSYPKSVYAVRDTLEVAGANRPDALILDFFAGSGTTLHATMLLNAEDGGARRCVLVTNNEVKAETADRLNKKRIFRGDDEFEAVGVFESATKPRITAAITGKRAAGTPLQGEYLDGREYAEGFEENVEFLRLDYLEPAAVELGLRFRELHPLFWLQAGGIGERETVDPECAYAVPKASPYGVLFQPAGMPKLLAELTERPDVTHVFIAADSDQSFADLASSLPEGVTAIQLYRTYLDTMRGAAA